MVFSKSILSVFVLFLLSNTLYGQNFEWLKTYGTKYASVTNHYVKAEPNGGCTFLMRAYGGTSPDTLKIGTFSYPVSNKLAAYNFLVRLDSLGKAISVKSMGSVQNVKMCRDEKGNLYLSATISGNSTVFDSLTLYNSNGSIIFAKYDNNLNRVFLKQSNTAFNTFNFSEGHLLFTLGTADTLVKLGTKTFHFKGENYIYGELDQSNGNIVWCNSLTSNSKRADYFALSELHSLKKSFYMVGTCLQDIKIGSDKIYYGQFVVQIDSAGNYIKSVSLRIKLDLTAIGGCIISDGEHLYISGIYNDTMEWNGKKIIPQFPPPILSQGRIYEPFIASFTASLQPRWFYRPTVLDKSIRSFAQINRAISNEGYIYFSGWLYNDVLFDSTILENGGYDIMFFKMDHLGNVLWAVNGGSYVSELYGLDAIAGKYVFASGYYKDSIHFGKYKSITKGFDDAWVTKISDNSIFRGNIYKGPYCAGDTIKIPFTKSGTFESTNYFLAELSDEEGNFDKGGGRELGRIKSQNSGTVIGKLPLFQVSTSGRYRIRIRSTHPPVQSFYRIDTLRLLIYSKDKANPGSPETICKGDTLKLSTYGGSQWKWSPKYNMDDSILRQPLVWPTKDTIYRIIIADSHGCGKPDTAFKKVFVRPYPKVHLAFNDTAVCGSGILNVPFYFNGGDSNYHYQWYYISSPKLWFATSDGQNVMRDTLKYPVYDPLEKLAIVLRDGCTSKPDTAYLIITQRKEVVLKTIFRDTSLCSGHVLKYKATITGVPSKYLKYQWEDLISNMVLSNEDSLNIRTGKTLKIQLIVNEGCEALGDTGLFSVNVKPELKATSNLRDTSLCFGKNINYTAQANGGDSMAYSFTWLLEGKVVSTTDNFALKTEDQFLLGGETKTLIFILKDNCSFPNDTIKKTIIVKPSPKAGFNYDLACSRTNTNFKFTGTKPLSPVTTTFNWNLNNEANSTVENPSKLFSTTGTKKINLTVSSNNGCMDTLTKDVVVQFQSTADFSANDVCESDSVVFINKSKDATGYRWRFGDGSISTIQSAKHKYQITSSTTFNVSLVAIVTNGCSDSIVKAVTINENPKSDFSFTKNGGKVDFKASQASAKSYRWFFGNGDSVKVTTQNYTYTYLKSGLYNICLQVINTAGCQSQICKEISITLGISSLDKLSGFKIYPNPNSGNFTIEIENPGKDVSIEVYDMMGKLLEIVESIPNKMSYPVNLNVANGIYLVKLKNGGIVYNQKVIVSK